MESQSECEETKCNREVKIGTHIPERAPALPEVQLVCSAFPVFTKCVSWNHKNRPPNLPRPAQTPPSCEVLLSLLPAGQNKNKA